MVIISKNIHSVKSGSEIGDCKDKTLYKVVFLTKPRDEPADKHTEIYNF